MTTRWPLVIAPAAVLRTPAHPKPSSNLEENMSDTNTNKAVARQFVDRVVSGHDLNGVDELLAANFVEHHATPGFAANKAGPARDVRRLLHRLPRHALRHRGGHTRGRQGRPARPGPRHPQ